MRIDVWHEEEGWRIVSDGATLADGLSRQDAICGAAGFARPGETFEMVIHYDGALMEKDVLTV